MNTLEHKIPPPVVALLMSALMWGVARDTPALALPTAARIGVAVMVALAGGGISLAGMLAFRRAKTTVNPLRPELATSLVSTGVYCLTRNPMYVGLLLVLVGWAVYLAAPWTLLGPVLFVAYVNRFQIRPEERVLTQLFGAEFSAYQAHVRRWL